MPSWTDKDERQFERITESLTDDGKSEDTAREIAARTVNKRRREDGETPRQTTQGTGNPNTRLEDRTKQELYNRAQELEIDGRSQMTKSELIDAIRDVQ